ncbi:hypothetical protein RFI_26962 [Reticulomyxa filosa]|uniref:ESF1 RRM domain-containing protein n=1 Tax=Reticulomyxa filosa TaxID=46433 RepID=X6M8V3_RETFI|nr:hypothetical protein RFI_26962 [Reticulomyxa filosa]|eukprot:ETO10413.1 hypothetical protein RFI_26962 [Reticulomyxa filosa]
MIFFTRKTLTLFRKNFAEVQKLRIKNKKGKHACLYCTQDKEKKLTVMSSRPPSKKRFAKPRTNEKSGNVTRQKRKGDARFEEVFTNPAFRPFPKKQKAPDKIKADERFTEIIDRYGHEVADDHDTELKRFYEMNNDNNKEQGEEVENSKLNLKSKSKSKSESKSKAKPKGQKDNNNDKKRTLTPAQQEILDEMHKDGKEIGSDDEFWNFWDKKEKDKEKADDGDEEASSENADMDPLTEERPSGQMFDYDAETTSSSENDDGKGDEYTPYEIGEDMRNILDWSDKGQSSKTRESDPTRRLAIVNLDWENVRAVDLFMIFRSFLPVDGTIVSVSIHPSEYGYAQMVKEEKFGPDPELWLERKNPTENGQSESQKEDNDDKSEDANGDAEHNSDKEASPEMVKMQQEMAELEEVETRLNELQNSKMGDVLADEKRDAYDKQALRKYELQRLRYYYAVCSNPNIKAPTLKKKNCVLLGEKKVAEFDSKETADHIYQECDGREFRFTANLLDLRFVAEDFVPPCNRVLFIHT